jgi:hypothetical protein
MDAASGTAMDAVSSTAKGQAIDCLAWHRELKHLMGTELCVCVCVCVCVDGY